MVVGSDKQLDGELNNLVLVVLADPSIKRFDMSIMWRIDGCENKQTVSIKRDEDSNATLVPPQPEAKYPRTM